MSCEICDRNQYHQNDLHCSNGLIGPKIKEWFDIDSDDEEEDPIKCDRCNANTYRSHQEYPDTWQYDYMAFCKDCLKEMNEYSDDEEVKPKKKKLIIKKKKKLIIKPKKKKLIIKPKEETITINPTNFKYPNRCSKIWNVEKQKDEWKQYLGAGQFCSPEIVI